MKRGIHAVVAGLVLLGVCGCRMMPINPFSGISVKVHKPFVIGQTEEAMDWGYHSHPYLYKFHNGRVVVMYCGDGDNRFTGLEAYASDDQGVTWYPYDMPEFPEGEGYSDHLMLPDGTSYLYGSLRIPYKGPEWKEAMHMRKIHPDGTMDDLVQAFFPVPSPMAKDRDQLVIYVNRGAVAPDGTLFRTGFSLPFPKQKKRIVYLYRSTNGVEFTEHAVVATHKDAPWGNAGPGEAALTIFPDGEMLMVMRSEVQQSKSPHTVPMLESRSTDGGVTWKHRKFVRGGVMPKLIQMSNGVLVCAFGRPGNQLIFSRDQGKTWSNEVSLTPMSAKTTGYCDIIEVSPGRLLAVYDKYDSPEADFWFWEPELRNYLFGVFIDVNR